jgi:hypothetical protein
MKRLSVTTTRLFGLILFVAISAWDIDAMRPHIAAHSWDTLAFVSLFLAAHLSDYLTVGRIVNRFDPLAFGNVDQVVGAIIDHERRKPALSGETAELYVFTLVSNTQAMASGAPAPSLGKAIIMRSK